MGKARGLWEQATTSFWLVPGLIALAIAALAIVTISLDETVAGIAKVTPWLLGGSPEGIRQVLAVVAGSVITVISVFFSITMVALQQASIQYSPRVLHTFIRDRGTQTVLGVYVGTFVYALLVLRTIRNVDQATARFTAPLSTSCALLLTLVCMGLLIYFIHAIARSLQVSEILRRIHRDLSEQIDHLYPAPLLEPGEPRPAAEVAETLRAQGESTVVRSPRNGFVGSVDEAALLSLGPRGAAWIYVMPEVGDYVTYGQPALEIGGSARAPDALQDEALSALDLGRQRSVKQDPRYPIRQLADVALRALSPSTNDPTTAQYAIHYLSDGLCRLVARAFPPSARTADDGGTTVVFSRPSWPDFVALGFDQLRRAAVGQPNVMASLVDALGSIARNAPSDGRLQPLREQLRAIEEEVARQDYDTREQEMLQHAITECWRAVVR